MTDTPTKKRVSRSPNYPRHPIDWAIDNGLSLLEKEHLHAVPVDVIAKDLGYKDAKNGAARRAIAALNAFGILQRASGGKLQVSSDLQRYKLNPNENDKAIQLKQWLKQPLLYSKLLDKYHDNLPSDQALIFELVGDYGFNESAAQNAIEGFRASLNFVEEVTKGLEDEGESESEDEFGLEEQESDDPRSEQDAVSREEPKPATKRPTPQAAQTQPALSEGVRYPVRLAGGRMAYIEVPDPFYDVDKKRLEAQLEIIGTVDEDNEFEELNM